METYLKRFMKELLDHKDNLGEYINQLYEDDTRKDDLNALFGALKDEGLLTCSYSANKAYYVQFTLKGKNLPASELKLSDKEELLDLISSIDDTIYCAFWCRQGVKTTTCSWCFYGTVVFLL